MNDDTIVDRLTEASLIHHLPATWSDERMHILDVDCWCGPEVHGEYLFHRRRVCNVVDCPRMLNCVDCDGAE